MEEVIQLLKESLEDRVFSRSEKRELKAVLRSKNFSKRELDFMRSQIFDIAKTYQDQISTESLLNWIEETNKLTLDSKKEAEGAVAYFSPGTACQSAIIHQIKSARSSLKICVFTISDNDISAAILAAHRRGVGVKLLTDNDKSFDRGSDIEDLANKGVPVKMDRTDDHMHHKFCIIDKETLLTGSYNWTRSAAERNHENILLTKEEGVVKAFLSEFEDLWEEMEVY